MCYTHRVVTMFIQYITDRCLTVTIPLLPLHLMCLIKDSGIYWSYIRNCFPLNVLVVNN